MNHSKRRRAIAAALDVTTALLAAIALTGPLFAARADTATSTPAAPVYRNGCGSIDGIGKFYEGREIAHVMGFEGADWLDRPTRQQEERPDVMVQELGLTPGMTVADIGAGSGYLSRRMARQVAPGKVYAVDVQPEMVGLLKDLAAQPGMGNIVPTQGTVTDVKLPTNSIDLAILVDVYHELEFPYEVIQSLIRALKPGGRLVFVEYRLEDPNVPIKALHRMSVAQVRREMNPLPVVWDHTSERLPIQHIIVFRRR